MKSVLFHGFFENFQSTSQFPYLWANNTNNENLGNLSQSQGAARVGIFAFPYFWLLALVIVLIKRYQATGPAARPASLPTEHHTFKRLLIWGLVATIVVSPVGQIIGAFSAGTALRYISDYTMMWTYVVFLAVLQLNFADLDAGTHSAAGVNYEAGAGAVNFRALSYLAIIALCLVTLIEHSFMVFASDRNTIIFDQQPELWVLLSRIFAPLSVAF